MRLASSFLNRKCSLTRSASSLTSQNPTVPHPWPPFGRLFGDDGRRRADPTPVAGIAMGLILEGDKYVILSDILGAEDALGDMDFKVAGDAHGITAFQLDIKVEGITHHIMQVALAQAKEGRTHILNKMLEICPKTKEELSAYAPRIETMQIKPSKIGIVIGPGGKQIRAIIEETGVQVDINDSGIVSLSSNNPDGMARAKEIIHNLTAEVEIGKTYRGKWSRSFLSAPSSPSSAKKASATSPKFLIQESRMWKMSPSRRHRGCESDRYQRSRTDQAEHESSAPGPSALSFPTQGNRGLSRKWGVFFLFRKKPFLATLVLKPIPLEQP